MAYSGILNIARAWCDSAMRLISPCSIARFLKTGPAPGIYTQAFAAASPRKPGVNQLVLSHFYPIAEQYDVARRRNTTFLDESE